MSPVRIELKSVETWIKICNLYDVWIFRVSWVVQLVTAATFSKLLLWCRRSRIRRISLSSTMLMSSWTALQPSWIVLMVVKIRSAVRYLSTSWDTVKTKCSPWLTGSCVMSYLRAVAHAVTTEWNFLMMCCMRVWLDNSGLEQRFIHDLHVLWGQRWCSVATGNQIKPD